MRLASEILNGSREELIAYLKSWDLPCDGAESDIELRLAAHKNFQVEGPGAGPAQTAEDAHRLNPEIRSSLRGRA